MASAKLILAMVFALTLSSGVVTGMLVSHLPGHAAATPQQQASTGVVVPAGPKTPMEQALNLKPAQQQDMQKIWEHVRDMTDDCYLQAQELQRQQWQALVDMLTPAQKAEFSKRDAEFRTKFEALKKRRETAFQEAVTRTDALLDASQRERFHELIKTRVGRSLGENPAWLNPGGGSDHEPATSKSP